MINKHTYDTYDDYVKNQIVANATKIDFIFALESSIKNICDAIKKYNPKLGICHGARNGAEVKWFNKHLKKCKTIGTDISGTARLFKDMIVHDMNKEVEAWKNRFDFVYSNSWDHAYNIDDTIRIWIDQLKENGFLILEVSDKHIDVNRDSSIDVYRMEANDLIDIVTECGIMYRGERDWNGRTILFFYNGK